MVKLGALLKDHLHVALYAYFWFGLFVCCLAAPDERVALFGSKVVTHGWHLALACLALGLPAPIVYWRRMRRAASANVNSGGARPASPGS
jgi:hypothetical protein